MVYAAAVLVGCSGSAIDAPIRVANGAGAVGDTAAKVLHEQCTERYKQIRAVDVPALDTRCEPARQAFGALRAAHGALVAGIEAARAGGDASRLPALVARLARASEDLSVALAALGDNP